MISPSVKAIFRLFQRGFAIVEGVVIYEFKGGGMMIQDKTGHECQIPDRLPTHGLIGVKKDLFPAFKSSIISHGVSEVGQGSLEV